MIVSALLLMASAPADCPAQSGPDAPSECRLAQSLRQLPDLVCEEDDSQMAMNVCSFREFLRADIALNQTWDRVVVRYRREDDDSALWQAVLNAQRAWLAFRDAQCGIWREYYKGGSIMPLVSNSCLTHLTEQRIEHLQDMLESPN